MTLFDEGGTTISIDKIIFDGMRLGDSTRNLCLDVYNAIRSFPHEQKGWGIDIARNSSYFSVLDQMLEMKGRLNTPMGYKSGNGVVPKQQSSKDNAKRNGKKNGSSNEANGAETSNQKVAKSYTQLKNRLYELEADDGTVYFRSRSLHGGIAVKEGKIQKLMNGSEKNELYAHLRRYLPKEYFRR
jgi:hypothetical protein